MPKPILGLQLYSLRREFDQDAEGTLRRVRGLGYDYIETAGTYGWSVERWRDLLLETGLRVAGAHLGEAELTTDLPAQIEFQRKLGNHRFILPYIPQPKQNPEGYRGVAEMLNATGRHLQKEGGSLYYHNHDFEFTELGDTTGFDILLRETDPALVKFEVDTYWVEKAGHDAAQFISANAARVGMIHAKEIRRSDMTDQAAGDGDIDFHAIVAFAHRHDWPIIVEFEGEGAIESSRKSADYLGRLIHQAGA